MKERKNLRLKGFDYSSEAVYFITSCCYNRINHFGNVIKDSMILNNFGIIATNQIYWLLNQYPYLIIHNFVVMPNHVHILLQIDKSPQTGRDLTKISHDYKFVGTSRDLSSQNNNIVNVGTGRDLSLQNQEKVMMEKLDLSSEDFARKRTTHELSLHNPYKQMTGKFEPSVQKKIKSISSIIGAYKTTTSKKIHLAGNVNFQWQRSFHDHIVRSQIKFEQIYKYIENNQLQWHLDSLNTEFFPINQKL